MRSYPPSVILLEIPPKTLLLASLQIIFRQKQNFKKNAYPLLMQSDNRLVSRRYIDSIPRNEKLSLSVNYHGEPLRQSSNSLISDLSVQQDIQTATWSIKLGCFYVVRICIKGETFSPVCYRGREVGYSTLVNKVSIE